MIEKNIMSFYYESLVFRGVRNFMISSPLK